MAVLYDFAGYATKNDIKCADGRIIRKNAFAHYDGQTVPLVWMHDHKDPTKVLGHALLHNVEDGLRAYCKLNDTYEAQHTRALIESGDVNALSIYANHLQQNGPNVLHGDIGEVSVVLKGANPEAYIDTIRHSDMGERSDGIYVLTHTDFEQDVELEYEEVLPTDTFAHADEGKEEEEKDDMAETATKTNQEIYETLNDEQKEFFDFMMGAAASGELDDALEDIDDDDDSYDDDDYEDYEDEEYDEGEDAEHSDFGGYEDMKHNVFDGDSYGIEQDELMHSAMETIISDAKRCGSLKESYLAHAEEYGITNIDWLFPDARNLTETPGFIKRQPDGWVTTVMNGTHHTPFSRIKMMFADLREDEARAKGYMKGKRKKEEVFGLLKRVVEPTTVYKKQKLDRDDVVDITDFNVVSWLKGEMRMMLDEELARAILFSDGRSTLSDDKINEKNIIPICKDNSLYTIHTVVEPAPGEEFAHAFINSCVSAQDDYEGSGNTKLFVANKVVTQMLLLEDKDGHRMYKDLRDLALACNVSSIVKVPASIIPEDVYGVIVDLNDYNVGADKGGAVNMFDDFDIDYNQQKYLIETRCSGALVKPYSAVCLRKTAYVESY